MALYTNESRDRVREAVNFLELVSARTELRRAGPARYEGLCPFHEERTPSFGIDPEQKVYHCFGCQASGDVFTFVQETEGVDFKGALELLADRYGVELEREQEDPRQAERRRHRERLLELLARTAAYYGRYLWDSREAARAREYLAGRGLGEDILRQFGVGYAPSAWDRVLAASRSGGFSVEDLYATGLAQRSRQTGQPYDRFRSRITFPLADIRGRVLGFGARAMREEQGPKYLNTADNDLYHKGQHLYGGDLARSHAAREGNVIVCEGYTDTIALHQAGMRNAVGLMGTALTGDQVAELARMAQTVLLALDADSSGQEAMLRASALAAKRKLELRVVELPAGTDPADLVQGEGAEAVRALIGQSVPFVRFRVERVLAEGDHSSPEGRDRMIEQLRPVFAGLPPSAMRMELTQLVSERLSLPHSLAERALATGESGSHAAGGGRGALAERGRGAGPSGGAGASGGVGVGVSGSPGVSAGGGGRAGVSGSAGGSAGSGARAPTAADPARGAPLSARGSSTERAFLALCIASPGAGEQALAELDLAESFTSALMRRAAEHLRAHLADPRRDLPADDPELSSLVAQLVVEAGRETARADMLEVQRLQLELARMDRQIQQSRAQRGGEVNELARRRTEVKREFERAYARVLEDTVVGEG
jgi:DNA primase